MNLRTSPLWLLLAAGLALGGCNCSEPVDELYPDASAVRCELSCDAGSTCVAVTGPGADASLACVPPCARPGVRGGRRRLAGGGRVRVRPHPAGRWARSSAVPGTAPPPTPPRSAGRRPGSASRGREAPGAAGFCGTAAGRARRRRRRAAQVHRLELGVPQRRRRHAGQVLQAVRLDGADPNPACEAGESCADLFPTTRRWACAWCRSPATGPVRLRHARLLRARRGVACAPARARGATATTAAARAPTAPGAQQCPRVGRPADLREPRGALRRERPLGVPGVGAAASDEYCGRGDICVRLQGDGGVPGLQAGLHRHQDVREGPCSA
jgi:hypothetical protein